MREMVKGVGGKAGAINCGRSTGGLLSMALHWEGYSEYNENSQEDFFKCASIMIPFPF